MTRARIVRFARGARICQLYEPLPASVVITSSSPRYLKRWSRDLKLAAQAILRTLAESSAELSIFLCDDDAIHALNERYRNVDRATDVLAFAAREALTPKHSSGEFLTNPGSGAVKFHGDKKLLGDVVISIQTAARQAAERGADQGHEIRYLLAHGILHLVGYDHATRAERRRMFAMTDVLMAATKCGYIASSRPEDRRRRRELLRYK